MIFGFQYGDRPYIILYTVLPSPVIVQIEKVELEGECRAKDKQLAVREIEIELIPMLRNELEELRVSLLV